MSRSSVRLSSSGYFCLLFVLVGLLAAPVRGQDVLETLEQGFKNYTDLVKASAEESARIALARDKFAKAPEGDAADATWKALEELLTRKDELYLLLGVCQGLDQAPESEVFRQRGTISVLAISGDIDGGIPGPGRAPFARLVQDMREELQKMGCEFQGPAGAKLLLFLPDQFYEAKARCEQQWSAYELRRKRVEFDRAGKLLTISDPRSFMIDDLQAQRDVSFEFAAQQYDALEAAVGKEKMQQTVEAVAASPQDVYGKLKKEALERLGVISSTDVPADQAKVVEGKTPDGRTVVWGTQPRAVLRGLLTRDNPRVAAMYAMNDVWPMGYEAAWQRLSMIEAAVGKQRFETALAEFHAAPRRSADGMLVTPVPPGDQAWMYRHYENFQAGLLAGDDAKAQVRYFIAIDPKMTPDIEDPAAAIDRRYEELSKLNGEQALLASLQKLRAAGWSPRAAGVATDRVVAALEKMLGLKGELNPHYFQWAGFGPGTTATYEIEIHRKSVPGELGGALKMKREVRVLFANEDGVALRVTESRQKRDGSWEASQPKTENIPAYQEPLPPGRADAFWGSLPFLPGGWLGFDHLGPEIDRQETASILIMEEVFDCTRSIWSGPRAQPQTFERRGGHPLLGSNVAEVWTNRQVPGWTTKAVRALPNSVTIVRLAEFDVKPAGEKLAASAAREAESLAWMRPSRSLGPVDPNLRLLDRGSRAWVRAPVGSRATHQFHYQGPSRQRSSVEEELNARIVSTLVEKDREAALVRSIWQDGDDVVERADFELGSAAETHYIGDLVTWMASNRQRAHPFSLAGDVARATVIINGQPVECTSYHHVPLAIPGKQLRAEQLVLSDSIPGAIVYLSVRNDPGTANARVAVTYTLEGLDLKSLPEPPKLVVKPKGGNFAVDQELMVDRHGKGKWERGKILRFTQLPNDAGGRYLVQIGRNPTWHNEDWLREHSRPLSEEDESATADDSPDADQAPPSPRGGTAPPRGDSSDSRENDDTADSITVGSRVKLNHRGTQVEATVVQLRGGAILVEFQDPQRDRTIRNWVRADNVQKLPASEED